MANAITDFYNFLSGDQYNDAVANIIGAANVYKGIQVPDLNTLIPQLHLQVQQGLMTPAQAEVAFQQASALATIQSDQATLFEQRAALNRLDEISKTGLTDVDRAAINAAFTQANANAAQQREAQVNAMRQQGLGGSGAELAARLAGSQATANANAKAGADVAMSAQQRALTALQEKLRGSAALNTQMFEQEAKKAAAQDTINQFNTQARNTMAEANARRVQEANLTNFNKANEIMAANVGIKNQQAMMPWNAAQQNWTNQLNYANAVSGAQLKSGAAMADLARNMAGNVTSGVSGVVKELGGVKFLKDAAGAIWKWVNNAWTPTNEDPWRDQPSAPINDGQMPDGREDDNWNTNPVVGPQPDTTPPPDPIDWDLGFRSGGHVNTDELMARMTGYKYRRKETRPEVKVDQDDARMKALLKLQSAVNKGIE